MNKLWLLLGILMLLPLVSASYWCYQEDAATTNQTGVDGNCGLSYSGSYSINNLTSYVGFMNMNYSKPVGAVNAYWQIKHGNYSETLYNISVPSLCFNQAKVQLRVISNTTTINRSSQPQCYDGSAWINVGTFKESKNDTGAYWAGEYSYDAYHDGNYNTANGIGHSAPAFMWDYFDFAVIDPEVLWDEAMLWNITNKLNIYVYDESTNTIISQNVSLQLISTNVSKFSFINGNINITDLDSKNYELYFSSQNYTTRAYNYSFVNTSTLSVFLLPKASYSNLTLNFFDVNGGFIDNLLVTQTLISNSSYLVSSAYTDIEGQVQLAQNPSSLYEYNCISSVYVCEGFQLLSPLKSSYDITLSYLSDLITYAPLSITADITNNNATNIISLDYVSSEVGKRYTMMVYRYVDGELVYVTNQSSIATTNSLQWSYVGYSDLVRIEGFADDQLFIAEEFDLGTAKLGSLLPQVEQAFLAAIIELVLILFFVRFGAAATMIGGVIGFFVVMWIGLLNVISGAFIAILIVAMIIISIALRRRY